MALDERSVEESARAADLSGFRRWGREGGEERERNQQENAKDLSNENRTILNTRLHPNQPYRTNGDVREHVVKERVIAFIT